MGPGIISGLAGSMGVRSSREAEDMGAMVNSSNRATVVPKVSLLRGSIMVSIKKCFLTETSNHDWTSGGIDGGFYWVFFFD